MTLSAQDRNELNALHEIEPPKTNKRLVLVEHLNYPGVYSLDLHTQSEKFKRVENLIPRTHDYKLLLRTAWQVGAETKCPLSRLKF